jgi:hypothetical protein
MGIYNDGEVTFGIPKTYCNGFVYSGVINSTLAKVLYGEVFPNVIFNGSTNIGSSPVISLYHTISPNFILPRNTQLLNSSNKVLLQATVAYTGSKVSIKTS